MQRTLLALPLVGLFCTAAAALCPGDCSGDNAVTVAEVMTCANIFLQRSEPDVCPAADSDRDGKVPIYEVVRAARSFLFGCPTRPPTPTPTPTAIPPATATPSATATEVPPATPTATPVPPTATPEPATRTPTATATATATATGAATCGNGLLEAGETCISCAPDCTVQTCTAATRKARFDVFFSADAEVTAVSLDLNYRSDLVQLPGKANETTVRARISGLPTGGQTILNDRDYGLRVVKSRTEPLPEGRFFTVEFDRCRDAAEPTVDDFACVIASCADSFSLPVAGCRCAVVIP